jgi:adenine phosphoribosyltransferase
LKYLKSKIRTVPHWPKKGIMFRDITTLLKSGPALGKLVGLLEKKYKREKVEIVAGVEARGFIVGGALAHRLSAGFVPIRKAGKLPAKTISREYELEYGKAKLEIHRDAIKKGQKVLLFDDLLATGGTALAACELVEELGGKIVGTAFIVDLPELGGRKKLEKRGYRVFSIVEFEGN